MSSHREEIAQKKARLLALRQERESRQKAGRQSPSVPTPTQVPDSAELLQEIDKVINGLKKSPVPRGGSRTDSIPSLGDVSIAATSEVTVPAIEGRSTSTYNLAEDTIKVIISEMPSPPPQEVHTYTKGVQTEIDWPPAAVAATIASPTETVTPLLSKRLSRREQQRDREAELRLRRQVEEELHAARELLTNGPGPNIPTKILTKEEKDALTSSEDFVKFIERSTKVIERALDQDLEYDILTDYTSQQQDVDDDDEEDTTVNSGGKGKRRVKEVRQFYDERWSKDRSISSINFSQKRPELVLASYTDNPLAPHDPDGVVQIWNMHMRDRPEFVFTAQSKVLSAKFSQHHPHLVVGGSYSGEVLLWDMRKNQRAPVNTSPLTGEGHTHPVYCVDVIGTPNDNCIISCSTDGAVRSWDFDVLRKPKQAFTLRKPSQAKLEDVNTTTLAFPHNDQTWFLAGTEEGPIFPCQRYSSATRFSSGIDTKFKFKGHTAPVMSVDFHPAHGRENLGDLVISSSLDWSVKLWRVPHSTSNDIDRAPLIDIAREDIVYDARWSPVRPSVFALVDGAGWLELWDLAVETEEPVARLMPSAKAGDNSRSLNKVAWEPNDGKRLATGGLNGQLSVFEVTSGLGGREDSKDVEWSIMKDMVTRLERVLPSA